MPRLPDYKETYPEELFSLMKEGKKGAHIFSHFKVCRKTFYNWLGKYPDFKDAYERGWEECEKHWENIGIQMIQEKDDKAFKPWIAFMNRNFGWAGKGGDQAGGTQINIGNMNVFQGQTKQELIVYIQEQLKELPVIDVAFEPVKLEPPIEDDTNGSEQQI